VRLAREVPLAADEDDAWRALSTLAPARGSAAGYAGTAVVEEADDDARTATLRLQGAAGAATVAVTATATVSEGLLTVTVDVRAGAGGEPPEEAILDEALGRLAATLAYALATAGRPRRAWDAPPPPTPTPAPAAWDAPSPLSFATPAPARREPIPETATLAPAVEVLTPLPADVLHPASLPAEVVAPAPDDHSRWVKVGVAAAAGLAAARILRGRR
jgi:hypothetical protein